MNSEKYPIDYQNQETEIKPREAEMFRKRQEILKQSFEGKIFDNAKKHIDRVENDERVKFATDVEMAYKLNVHFPSVRSLAEKLYPGDELVHLMAAYHDYGRSLQYQKTGTFADGEKGSARDHHTLGAERIEENIQDIAGNVHPLNIDANKESVVIYALKMAAKCHGLRNIAFHEDFERMDKHYPEIADAVEKVSLLDEVVNAVMCVGYLVRETQKKTKNESIGGYIPDDRQYDKTISEEVMQFLERGKGFFNREAVCKTYPEYYAFFAFLAARSLSDPKTREATKMMFDQPADIEIYETGEDGKEKLSKVPYPTALEAMKAIFLDKNLVEEKYGKKVVELLQNYYDYGQATKPEAV